MKSKFLSLMILSVMFTSYGVNNPEENFIFFLGRFSTDQAFQESRVNFPLEKIVYNKNDESITFKIGKDDWSYIRLIPSSQVYLTNITCDFEEKECDTDERILEFFGIETGIELKYFFKLLDGNWYLVKIEDFST